MIPAHLQETITAALRLKGHGVLEGWTTPERGIELAELIYSQKPKVAVEIGCFGMRSAIAQGMAMRELEYGILYTIDPWKKEEALEGECEANRNWWKEVDLHNIHTGAIEAVWRYGLDEYIVTLRAASQHCYRLWSASSIDMLGIDGSHTEPASCRDVTLYLPLVRSGGIIWFDDSDWPTTQKALQMLDAACIKEMDSGKWRVYRKT